MILWPLGDEYPLKRKPFATAGFIALNIVGFLVSLVPEYRDPLSEPDWLMGGFFSSFVYHAHVWHLAANLVYLWTFGSRIEDDLGPLRYSAVYLLSAAAGAAAHALAAPRSAPSLPLGAAAAISGVIAAHAALFPHLRIRLLLWAWVYSNTFLTPVWVWIAAWLLMQHLFALRGAPLPFYASLAAGMAVGAAAGLALDRLGRGTRPRPAPRAPAPAEAPRRAFSAADDDPLLEFPDEPQDAWAVVRLRDGTPAETETIAPLAAAATGEDPAAAARRIDATVGVLARSIPRPAAEKLRADLAALGVPAALIVYNRTNFPPAPVVVEFASWNEGVLRMRMEDRIVPVPWSSPFLVVGARIGDAAFVDLFLNRRSAFRLHEKIRFTRVDSLARSEQAADLATLAREFAARSGAAFLDEGIRLLAAPADLGRLAFKIPADYDDYLFWTYNLVLSGARSGKPT